MKIALVTANARYSHCALGLRCLKAALDPLGHEVFLKEFTIHDRAADIVEAIVSDEPEVVGVGLYIWNVALMVHVTRIIRSIRPGCVVILGGPEVYDATETSALAEVADFIIVGEGEEVLTALISQLSRKSVPNNKVIQASPVSLTHVPTPYAYYTEEDIRNRIIYVESSRGCPYSCAFCLSSGDKTIRFLPLSTFFSEIAQLLKRGVRLLKFTDRTFNIRQDRESAILKFFLECPLESLQLHFEIRADRLSLETRELMAQFPPGTLHLEVGLQSYNPETLKMIGRSQSLDQAMDGINFLCKETGAVIHADLIAGLPGDTWEDIRNGVDRLVSTGVQELQLGFLKRLKGTPINTMDGTMLTFDAEPPYEILRTSTLSFEQLRILKRTARVIDLFFNSGNFKESIGLLWTYNQSPFEGFVKFAEYLWQNEHKMYQLSLARCAERLYQFLVVQGRYSNSFVAETIERDFRRHPGRHDKLNF